MTEVVSGDAALFTGIERSSRDPGRTGPPFGCLSLTQHPKVRARGTGLQKTGWLDAICENYATQVTGPPQ